MANDPHIQSGQVILLRLFDVAYEIDLQRVEQLRAARATAAGATRSRLSTAPPKGIAFGVAPVSLPLEPVTIEVDGRDYTLAASARAYEFGVVTLSLRADGAALRWSAFADLANALDRAAAETAPDPVWPPLLARLLAEIAPALSRPVPPGQKPLSEDYLLGIVHGFAEPILTAAIGRELDLVPLLSGETRPLAESARAELLANRFSYYTDDLVVLTWDRAFIYEPRRDNDVADVLEVANAQLLEMRHYDELLDDELPRMYDLVEDTRRRMNLIAPRRFAALARRLYTLVAEVTELAETVDNALQVTEDVYLARIYTAALTLYRVPLVSAAVDRKLSIIRDTYTALFDEASASRAGLLEILIVLLIMVEIVLAVTGH